MIIRITKAPKDLPISVFLAGGITNCPDWQKEVEDHLHLIRTLEFIIYNPRRDDWKDLGDKDLIKQITWEHNAIRQADMVSFWFPKETLCPITLFELGAQLELRKPTNMVIGCHPEYARKKDVEIQAGLKGFKVYDNLFDLGYQLSERCFRQIIDKENLYNYKQATIQ